jgi:HK97 family phage major capsid protein/HK97 family phage prohead protease
MPYKPTDGMKTEAQRGLDWREEYGRGGTEIGIGRARDIVAGRQLSEDVVKRMYSFFSRHEVDKQAEGFRPGEEGYPSNGRIAWALWGGDAGFSWSKDKVKSMEENRAAPEEVQHQLNDGDFDGIHSEEATEDQLMSEEESRATVKIEIEIDTEGHTEEEVVEDVVDETVDIFEEERKAPVEVLHRAIDMEAKAVDEKKRTVDIAVSSELAVDRSFGKEVLVHEMGAIDLAFLASGRAPLLLDHDMERQIGVIESVELSGDRVLRAKVRFGRSALAQEVFQDVVDGIRSNVSVGYRVNKMERSTTNKDEYLVRSWSPLEVSVVSIPADPSVGVGRSAAALEPKPTVEPSIKKEVKMTDEVNLDAVRAEANAAAARNASDIIALGARHNKRDLADAAIRSGKSIEQFRGELLEVIGSDKPLENETIGLNSKEVRSFSIVRAIAALANPGDRRLREAAAFEFEASEAAAQRYGRSAQGLMVPVDVLGVWKQRDLNTSDDNEIVATNLLANEFIDVLRNSVSVMAAGARMLPGLQGNVAIPKKTAASSGGWISTEGGAASESEPTFGTVSLTPKNVGAFTDITRQLILQSTPAVEALVRDDLTQALALAIDKGALEGSGSSGQPTGILNTSGVNKPTSFAAAVPTFAEMVALETAIAEDNALMGNLAYITDAATYGGLKTKAKDAGSGMFVLENGQANGYNVIRSQQATAGNVYFGNFSDLLIGMWAGLDILVDPYTASSSGNVRVRAIQTVDVAVRNAVSFAYNNDGA